MTTKKMLSKFSITMIVIALLVVGGGASAFFLMNKSPKQAYFHSEVNTAKNMSQLFEERYQNEFNWQDIIANSVTENTYDLSAEVSNSGYAIDEEIASLINSATATLQVSTDPKNRLAKIGVSASIASSTLDGIQTFMTPEKVLVTMPFMDEWVQLKDDEFGKFMYNFNVNDFNGDEELGLSNFMKKDAFFSEADQQYLQKEYIEYLYEQIPEEAFRSEKENIEVDEKKIKATKISMNLTDQDIKKIMRSLLEKVKNDEKLHDMLENNLKENTLLSQYSEDDLDFDLSEFRAEFKEGLDTAMDYIDDLYFENGIQSTIWEHANLIVKRDLQISVGTYETTDLALSLTGEQLLDKTTQQWTYTLDVSDEYDDYTMDITGDLSWNGKQATDFIEFSTDGFSVIYEGDEELVKNEREFSRRIQFSDGYDEFNLNWDGTAVYEKDSKLVNHAFFADVEGETVGLNITDHSKIIKKLEEPEGEIINLGDMNNEELIDYIIYDVQDRFYTWLGELMVDLEI